MWNEAPKNKEDNEEDYIKEKINVIHIKSIEVITLSAFFYP